MRHRDGLKSPTVMLQGKGLFPHLKTIKLTAKQQFVCSQEGTKTRTLDSLLLWEKNEESTRGGKILYLPL